MINLTNSLAWNLIITLIFQIIIIFLVNVIIYWLTKYAILLTKKSKNRFWSWIFWRSNYYIDVLAKKELWIELITFLSIMGIIMILSLINKQMLINISKLMNFKLSLLFIPISYIAILKTMIIFVYKMAIYVRVQKGMQEKNIISFSEYKRIKTKVNETMEKKNI